MQGYIAVIAMIVVTLSIAAAGLSAAGTPGRRVPS